MIPILQEFLLSAEEPADVSVPIEQLLSDFGNRCDMEDIRNFAGVYGIARESRGNLSRILQDAARTLNDRIRSTERGVEACWRLKDGTDDHEAWFPAGIILYMQAISPGFLDVLYGRRGRRLRHDGMSRRICGSVLDGKKNCIGSRCKDAGVFCDSDGGIYNADTMFTEGEGSGGDKRYPEGCFLQCAVCHSKAGFRYGAVPETAGTGRGAGNTFAAGSVLALSVSVLPGDRRTNCSNFAGTGGGS